MKFFSLSIVYLSVFMHVSVHAESMQNKVQSRQPLTTDIRKNMFGTDGIRATVGNPPFTASDLFTLGQSIGQWVIGTYGKNATVLIGHDTRLSCSFVKSSLKSGLLTHPICLVDASVMPTPALVQLCLNHDTISCGIMISASHNPYQDNGIKIIDGSCGKLSSHDEEQITTFFDQKNSVELTELGQERYWQNALQVYCDTIQQYFKANYLQGQTVVLDCANGATHECAIRLFEQLGADVISMADAPDGRNINENCGAVHPERCAQLVKKHKADAGFAFDGDGDRVIAINREGQIKDGDDILSLLLEHPVYAQTHTVVGTIMTNKGLQDWLAQQGKSLHRTQVGDKYIARKIQQDHLLLGGEQSGHIILNDYLPTGDGIFTALRVMQVVTQSNRNMETFERFPQVLVNVAIAHKKDLTQEPFASIIKQHEASLSNGRLVARFSGTENKLRVMIENDNKQQAEHVAQACAHALKQALGGQ